MALARLSIKTVAHRTGLSAHVIRVWEKRYGTIQPVRTPTNRRMYSEDDVERLNLLKQLTNSGYSIGNVAALPGPELKALLEKEPLARQLPENRNAHKAADAETNEVADCLEAIRRLDAHRLEELLRQANLRLGSRGVLQKVVSPLAQEVGRLWYEGEITAAHEHFASGILRVFLGAAIRPFPMHHHAPRLIGATPVGQVHELGAVIAAAAAASMGWNVTYLGASLPAAEIAGAATQNRAQAVALSLVYPADDPAVSEELENLRRYLPPEVQIFVGGRAAASYQRTLINIGAIECATLDDFCIALSVFKSAPPKEQILSAAR